ncbi:uncharacterized protein LOC108736254 [Agrilus planipennis]|uniref:Uncharacterized protein LOC108736254 n=1 Tax=Agrilus planipennis TaxID=224129 RepID=A0A1W4WJL4_AGRPL|nr:uncharacterized protein LOC108736254 [Agrilus planipennis]
MSEVIVKAKQGLLRGKVVEDVRGEKHYAFLGIPYGKPPVGALRFKAPQPADSWSGVRDALEEGNPCKSKHSEKFHLQGDEDCLYLNVYTPQLPSLTPEKPPLAVMVWIHGGGFHTGSSTADTYGPFFILTENVVFVSINYRLGIFGFLSFDDPSLDISGNAGLKDQALALKWVKENISAFGGDENNITIFGESAGAASVHYQILSPTTKGFFHKAILQSGVAINPWAQGRHLSDELAEILKIPGASEKKVYEELMKKNADELHELQIAVPDHFESGRKRPWVPVIEKPSPNAFITEDPIEILKSGKFHKIPILMGYTSREGLLMYAFSTMANKSPIIEDTEQEVPHFLNFKKGSPESKKIAESIKNFYFGKEEPSSENIDKGILLTSDTFFIRGIQSAAKHHVKSSGHPVYLYRFSIDAGLNFLKNRLMKLKESGTCHADDLGYIFHSEWTPYIVPDSHEDIIQRSVLRLWANFSKHSNPNVGPKDNLIKIEWKPIDQDTLHFLDIGENLTVGVDPDQSRMEFWNKIFKGYDHAKHYNVLCYLYDKDKTCLSLIYAVIIIELFFSVWTGTKDEMQFSPIIETKQGLLRGIVKDNTYTNIPYFAFLGVPYALPPLNDLRFQSPKEPQTWEGVRDVIDEQPGCYSRHPIFGSIVGCEDCLYINVFSPELPEKKVDFVPKPVMVYIHGGSFIQGSGSLELYGPEFLIAENVVLITFNYRVGLLGFLSLQDPSLKVPGNAGLKDIVMALKWIQQNIASFGGDPQNVTIFGCSAGAGSAHHLIASPMGKGLFHKAILQSGSLFCPWSIGTGYVDHLKEVLHITNEKDMLEVLRSIPDHQLLELQEKLKETHGNLNKRVHGPVIEKNNSGEEPFLSEDPLDLILSGRYNKVPIIIGYSNREGLVYAIYNKLSDGTIQQLPSFEQIIPQWLGYPNGSSESKTIAEQIKRFYYGEEEPCMANVDNLYLLLGDSYFLSGIAFTVRAHVHTSSMPIYLYRFSIDGRLNLYKRSLNLEFYGACHADELGYLFKGILSKQLTPNSKEEITMKRMTKLWTNFAKTGDPNPAEEDSLLNVKWEKCGLNAMNFLEIGDDLTTGKNPDYNRMSFWDDIYKSNPSTSKHFIVE